VRGETGGDEPSLRAVVLDTFLLVMNGSNTFPMRSSRGAERLDGWRAASN